MAAQAGLCLIFQKSSKTGLNRVQSQSPSRVMSVSNWLEAQPGHILSVRNGLSLILSYSMSYVCCLTTTGLDVKVDPHLRWAHRPHYFQYAAHRRVTMRDHYPVSTKHL